MTSVGLAEERLWTDEGLTTVPALLRRAVAQWPERCFLDFSGERFSYAQIDIATDRMAAGLSSMGVAAGDTVCVMFDNVADLIVIWFAANKLGAIFVPFNTTYKGTYLSHQIRDSGARVMFVEDRYLERVVAVHERSWELEKLVCRGVMPDCSSALEIVPLDSIPRNDALPIDVAVLPETPSVIHYTSGTTGPSKGGVMGHGFVCNMGAQQVWVTDLTGDDVIWTPCPLFHGTGMFLVIAALTAGATASIYPHFSVSAFWPEIERSGATVVLLLSVMLSLIPAADGGEAAKRCHGQIRVLYGTPLGTALKAEWKKRFGVKYASSPGYGMTEASMVTITRADDPDVPGEASGRRFADFDVRIVDENGNECPPNVTGEVILRPRRPGIMFQGYWRRPEATLAVFRDLWYWTGDLGKFDENDYFYFVDRKKDYLRKGGENISSFEVEQAFQAHPEVLDVAAHAVPSDLAEDELKVAIIRAEGAEVSEAELHAWCAERLPKFAVPRYIEFRADFPRTANGKVKKDVLRLEGITGETWDYKTITIRTDKKDDRCC